MRFEYTNLSVPHFMLHATSYIHTLNYIEISTVMLYHHNGSDAQIVKRVQQKKNYMQFQVHSCFSFYSILHTLESEVNLECQVFIPYAKWHQWMTFSYAQTGWMMCMKIENLTIFHMAFDLCLLFRLLIAATVMITLIIIIIAFRYVLGYEN